MNKKKLLSLILALGLTLSLAACGSDKTTEPSVSGGSAGEPSGESVTLTVAASPTPHAEILNQVKDVLAEQGVNLVVKEYTDYPIQNTAVEDGEVDANYFQHTPYLENFNAEHGTHLVSVVPVHYEPMGVYAGKTASIDKLADGATIAIPNDATNEGRALLLLEAQGLIKLADSSNLESTPRDIAENPKNLEFLEVEAAMVPKSLDDVDLAVINANYALQNDLDAVNDPIAIESADGTPYPNVLVVKEGSENSAAVQALAKALQSDAVRDYINETYSGAVVPLF